MRLISILQTEIGLSVNHDIIMLLTMTLLVGLYTTPSLVMVAASNSSDLSANLTASTWIVEGNATGNLIPNCSDLCLRVDDTDTNFGVVVQHCQGGSNYELWSYNAETKTLASAIASSNLCLDSTDYPSRKLHLSECNSSVAAQQWTWDNLAMTLSTTGISSTANSSLNSSNSTANASANNNHYYLMGELYNQSYWGSGTNVFDARLGSSDDVNGEESNFTAIFSFINYTNPLEVNPWNYTELTELAEMSNRLINSSSSLVFNGGFEHCGYDPGAGFATIATTDPLYLCAWRVMSNEIEYTSVNLWKPQEGNHSLHMNSAHLGEAGAVMQQIAVTAGQNYTLSFYMAGHPIATCGSKNKTLQVGASPSSLAVQVLWFDIETAQSDKDAMGWQLMGPMGFTASGDFVNVTFRSLTAGSCGPVIDNVVMVAVNGSLPPPWTQPSAAETASDKGSRYWKRVAVLSAIGVTTFLLVIVIFVKMMKRHMQQNSLPRGDKPVTAANPVPAAVSTSIEDSWDDMPVQKPMDSGHVEGRADQASWWSSLEISEMLTQRAGEEKRALSAASASLPPFIKEWTWLDVQRYTRNFRKLIGEGGFSRVYLAKVPASVAAGAGGGGGRVAEAAATFVAVKIEKSRDRSRQMFKQELTVVSRLRHPYLVSLLGFCNEREEGILVLEYMGNGNLHNRLHPPAHEPYKELSWDKRMDIARRVAEALCYLHSSARPRVLHGDVKSANVLLDNQDNAKLCDFGFARRSGIQSSTFHTLLVGPHVQGSLGYLDPEYLEHGRLSTKSDVYSFGVLLLELITGLRAFDMHRSQDLPSFVAPYLKDDDSSMMQLIVDSRLSSTNSSELMVACHVSRMCLRVSPIERPTMVDVARMLSFHMKAQSTSGYEFSSSQQFVESTSDDYFFVSTPISPR